MKKKKETTKTLVFDTEANGLLLDGDKFWVGVTYCLETKETRVFYTPNSLIQELNSATTIIGHNIIGYDIPALNKLSKNIQVSEDVKVVDTLLLAKLIYYDKDKSWSHSLDAYGERLGEKKGNYSDWSKYTKEMEEYCIQDVRVTTKLYKHLKRKGTWLPETALQLEQDVQKIITEQYVAGWEFDIKKAQKLHIQLLAEKDKAEEELFSTFKPRFIKDGKEKTPKKPFKRLGVTTVGTHQPLKYVPFNPASGAHIVWWVDRELGKQNWVLTEKGNPKTDSDTLKDMFKDEPFIKPLLHYLEVNKLLGQLAEGDKAWLRLVRSDGRIHGSADILGAVTGRFTHSNPNLAQVPSVKAFMGKEARSLFKVRKGYKLVGADASGLELRTLSHYLTRFDGGVYGKQVLEGDIHTANQEAAGLPTRDNAKTFIYGFLYGAGDAKLGTIVNGTKAEGARLKRNFLAKTVGLKKLVEDVKKVARQGYLRGLSGRRLFIRSPHSALNTLLQSAGAYYMKYLLIATDKLIKDNKYDATFVGNIHDEFQIEVKEEQAEEFAKKLESLFITVGEELGMRIKMEGKAKIGDNWMETH